MLREELGQCEVVRGHDEFGDHRVELESEQFFSAEDRFGGGHDVVQAVVGRAGPVAAASCGAQHRGASGGGGGPDGAAEDDDLVEPGLEDRRHRQVVHRHGEQVGASIEELLERVGLAGGRLGLSWLCAFMTT